MPTPPFSPCPCPSEPDNALVGDLTAPACPDSSGFTSPAGQTVSLVSNVCDTFLSAVVGEVPEGPVDGSNTNFTIAQTALADSEAVYVNGARKLRGTDYELFGVILTFTVAPASSSVLLIDYWYASEAGESTLNVVNSIKVQYQSIVLGAGGKSFGVARCLSDQSNCCPTFSGSGSGSGSGNGCCPTLPGTLPICILPGDPSFAPACPRLENITIFGSLIAGTNAYSVNYVVDSNNYLIGQILVLPAGGYVTQNGVTLYTTCILAFQGTLGCSSALGQLTVVFDPLSNTSTNWYFVPGTFDCTPLSGTLQLYFDTLTLLIGTTCGASGSGSGGSGGSGPSVADLGSGNNSTASPLTVTSGSLLVVILGYDVATAPSAVTFDSLAMTKVRDSGTAPGCSIWIYNANTTISGNIGVTSTANGWGYHAFEITGLASNVADVGHSGSGSSSAPNTGTTATTAVINEIAVAGANTERNTAWPANGSWNSPFTLFPFAGSAYTAGGHFYILRAACALLSSLTTVDGIYTGSSPQPDTWSAVVETFE